MPLTLPAADPAPRSGQPALIRRATLSSRYAVGVIVFVAAWAASAFYARGLSTVLAPDSPSYFSTLPALLRPSPGWFPLRTPFYPALTAVVHASGGSVGTLVLLQEIARAVACAAVAWHLARSRPRVALGTGLLLAADPVAGSMTSAYLSESFYSTGLLLGLAVLVAQLQAPVAPGRGRLVSAGVVFGFACLFRPSGLPLMVPVVAAYWIVTGSLVPAAWVTGGFSLVATAVVLFNYLKAGVVAIATSGVYVAFPLFTQHLFAPSNGPASATLHAHLQACDPGVRYDAVVLDTSNAIIHGRFGPCLTSRLSGGMPEAARLYSAAYGEALVSHPLVFAERMLAEGLVFLGTPASAHIVELAAGGDDRALATVCARAGAYAWLPADFVAFSCPTPTQNPTIRHLLETWGVRSGLLHQPYMAVYALTHTLHLAPARTGRLLAGVAGTLFFGFALAAARPPYRPWIVGAVTVVVGNAATTALGAVTLVRYAAVNSPFLLLISALTLASLVERRQICAGSSASPR